MTSSEDFRRLLDDFDGPVGNGRKNAPDDVERMKRRCSIDRAGRSSPAAERPAPRQIAEHLNRAFTDAFRMGAGSVTREIVEETISAGFDDLDARLARVGYTPKALAEQFDIGQAEARRFLKGKLDTDRTHELGDLMRQAGLPI